MDGPLESGLTKFQEICLDALTKNVDVKEVTESWVDSDIEGLRREKSITGRLKKSNIIYYIYEDGA